MAKLSQLLASLAGLTGPAGPVNIVDAKGDLVAGTANDAIARLAAGANGAALLADSTQTAGLRWGFTGLVSQSKTASFTAVPGFVYLIDSTSGPITVTLPAANVVSQVLGLKWVAGTATVTVQRAGSDTIGSATTSAPLGLSNEIWELTSSGSGQWNLTGGNKTLSSLDARYSVNTQDFTASGTWTNPSPTVARPVRVYGHTAGSGGGTGRRGAAGTVRCAGGGGAAGAPFEIWLLSTELPATVPVVVGAGGTAGTPVTTNDTDGNPGGNGGNTSFGASLTTYRAGQVNANTGGGRGGTATSGAGGASNAAGPAGGGASATGGTGNAPGSTTLVNGYSIQAGTGGGSGGGITAADSPSAGGAGGSISGLAGGGAAGSGATGTGGAGTAGPVAGVGGFGGGGGAAAGTNPVAGAGAFPGGGGGGGGASVNGAPTPWQAAPGADGFLRVQTYL